MNRILLLVVCFGVSGAFALETANHPVLSLVENGKSATIVEAGIGTTIIVVFIVLVLMLWGFRWVGNLMIKKVTKAEIILDTAKKKENTNTSDEEVIAAISMALHLYTTQIHDQENPIITMIKVSRTYSPWSSKIYGLRKSPR